MDVEAVYRVERHNLTDEVFILWRGSGALVIAEPEGTSVVDATPGMIYNVTIGTWHTVITTRDSSWIIVENKDTHQGDTEYRAMTSDELNSFMSQLPAWAQCQILSRSLFISLQPVPTDGLPLSFRSYQISAYSNIIVTTQAAVLLKGGVFGVAAKPPHQTPQFSRSLSSYI